MMIMVTESRKIGVLVELELQGKEGILELKKCERQALAMGADKQG